MKNYLLFAALCLCLFCSCKTPELKNFQANCDIDKTAMIAELAQSLAAEGFIIKNSDQNLAYIYGESSPEFSLWPGTNCVKSWSLQYSNNKLIATYRVTWFTEGSTKNETMIDEDVAAKESSYWTIRNKIGKICKNIEFIVDGVNISKPQANSTSGK